MWRCTKLTILKKNTLEKWSHGEGQEISGNTSEHTEATMENIPALRTKRVWLKKPAWLGSNELQVCREPGAPGDHPAPRHSHCREKEREVTQKTKLKISTITLDLCAEFSEFSCMGSLIFWEEEEELLQLHSNGFRAEYFEEEREEVEDDEEEKEENEKNQKGFGSRIVKQRCLWLLSWEYPKYRPFV